MRTVTAGLIVGLAMMALPAPAASEGRMCSYAAPVRRDFTICRVVYRFGEYRCRCKPLNTSAARQRNQTDILSALGILGTSLAAGDDAPTGSVPAASGVSQPSPQQAGQDGSSAPRS